MKKSEEERGKEEINGNVRDSDRKATDSASTRRKSFSVGIVTGLNKALENNQSYGITQQQEQNYSERDADHDRKSADHHHGVERQEIYDFTGSLQDELSVAAIGTGDSETILQAVFVVFHSSNILIF
uniref:Uncharacterized protein n=1 Tax=Elaeophora elaphi TaxID=1147741 RepID=A0A0R3RR86_9BILA